MAKLEIKRLSRFVFACLLVFLASATLSGVLRAKYESLPEQRATYAELRIARLGEYAFLQASQASPDRGRQALLVYVNELREIQRHIKMYPEKQMHFDIGTTELRLYSLESVAGNSREAGEHMSSAQTEFAALGWKDTSRDTLAKLISTREANEAKLYDVHAAKPAAAEPPGCNSKRPRK